MLLHSVCNYILKRYGPENAAITNNLHLYIIYLITLIAE